MFELVNINGVCFLKSTRLKSNHGFSTRIGGVSELEYTQSLNLAFGRGDDEEIVRKNVEIFAQALGIDGKSIISVPQVHSNEVRMVSMADAGEGVDKKATFSCDGYATVESGLPIGIKTADCVPILLEARNDDGEVIAVSAVHAGWRGTAERIAEGAVQKLCLFGVEPKNIYVAIGPCIDECCYEVGNDFADKIAEKLGQKYEIKFISKAKNGSLFANLKGMNLETLLSCGVPRENIDISDMCTCCNPKFFYSHRRQKGVRGAHLNVIVK